MKHIGVIGCGTMGLGIAQVAASNNHSVFIYDSFPSAIDKARINLNKTLQTLFDKEKISKEKWDQIIANITWCIDLNEFKNCEFVIEAIVENFSIKKTVFENLSQIVSDTCIIASNTSSLSITSLASCVKNPKRFIGVHFFNPAPVMPLVEIIPGIQTEENSLSLSKQLLASWKKEIVVAKDTPGFIVNRIARPYYGEAIRIYEENLASKEYIDQTMKKLGGFKMGPFELMDFIGHDVNYAVTESVWTAFYFEPKYKPSLSQKRLVEAAYLGRKSGRGFYNYEDVSHESKDIELDLEKSTMIFERIICMLIHEAADALYLEIASKEDIETAMCKGVNYPKGLLHWADEIGIEKCVSILNYYYNLYHEERYRCSAILQMMAKSKITFFNHNVSVCL